jgi:hypothetical protein
MKTPLCIVAGALLLTLASSPASSQPAASEAAECCILDLVGIIDGHSRSGEHGFHGGGPAGGLTFSARRTPGVGIAIEATRGSAFIQRVTFCTELAERCLSSSKRERNWTASVAAVWRFSDANRPNVAANVILGVGLIARDQDGVAAPHPMFQDRSPRVQWINSIVGGAGFDVMPTRRLTLRVEYRMAFRIDATIQHLRAGIGVRFDKRSRTNANGSLSHRRVRRT